MESTTYDESLTSILEQVHTGRIQVPEFQRAWRWDDALIRGLVASVSLGYPIGALTLLDAGSSDTRFDSHPIAGAPTSTAPPQRFLIDGLQRLTALYQVFMSPRTVQTVDDGTAPAHRRYYVDVAAAVDPQMDRDHAILSVPAAGHAEQLGRCFPLGLALGDHAAQQDWLHGFASRRADDGPAQTSDLVARFEAHVLRHIESYALPVIHLDRGTTRWTVRVHGGPDGPVRSDRYRVPAPEQ